MAWNGSGAPLERDKSNGFQEPTHTPRRLSWIWAVAFVAFCASLAFYFFNDRPDSPSPKAKPDRNPVIENRAATVAAAMPCATNVMAVAKKEETRRENGSDVLRTVVTTNANGTVIERIWLANGTTKRKVHPKKPLFKNAADQLIATVLSTKPGQSMPPLPDLKNIDNDFMAAMLSPIRLNDADSQDDRAMKLRVMEARAYISAEMKKGRSVQDCLIAHRDEMERIADSHAMAVREILKMREDGCSSKDISVFRNRVNEVLRAKGLPTLPENEDSHTNDKE